MIGSDICGYAENTTQNLCARWAMLGAFYPFMRDHNSDDSISQEFYRWAVVTEAAKHVLDIHYRLLDYMYTAFHQAHLDGTPVLHPVWFKYPKDTNTFDLEFQFFYGDSILVSPVTGDDATSVSIYLPQDIFYDFDALSPVQGTGSFITLDDVPFTRIPLHIKGGAQGEASGTLYFDDGESIAPASSTNVNLQFKHGKLDVQGTFGHPTGVNVSRVRFLGVSSQPHRVLVNGKDVNGSGFSYDPSTKILDVMIGVPFVKNLSVQYL